MLLLLACSFYESLNVVGGKKENTIDQCKKHVGLQYHIQTFVDFNLDKLRCPSGSRGQI